MAGAESKSRSLWLLFFIYEDAGALESNGQSSDALKHRGRYHITPTRGKKFISEGMARLQSRLFG